MFLYKIYLLKNILNIQLKFPFCFIVTKLSHMLFGQLLTPSADRSELCRKEKDKWQMANLKWKMENGKSQITNLEWQIANH